ncbi:hypothetical protein CEXT_132001 [Caerostris extrusa]|uniref:Uncharacterized protein n=1 Tax=Caerostris extrusa TaxID=172846 RepID=A0AAV4Y1S5_CAEEX|nr:hypothetical protein CEXT_132001 [Caerostris extrusa]
MSGGPPTASRIMISSHQVLPDSSWPIIAIRLCMVHPSVFLEQMSAANDPEEVPPGPGVPVLICKYLPPYGRTIPPQKGSALFFVVVAVEFDSSCLVLGVNLSGMSVDGLEFRCGVQCERVVFFFLFGSSVNV